VKLALISDIHSNLEALDAVIADARAQGADAFACLGDIVGYGADPVACLERVQSLAPIAVIQGNHDAYAADERDLGDFNPLASKATVWTRRQLTAEQRSWLAGLPLEARIGREITLVHANPSEPDSWAYVRFPADGALALLDQKTRLCFYGHTHLPMAFRQLDDTVLQLTADAYNLATGERWLVNVGSVGQPRDGDWRAAYSLLDEDGDRLSVHRVEYDLATCQQKIVAAGLPARLAERLAVGR